MKNNGSSGLLIMKRLLNNSSNCAILYLTIQKHAGKEYTNTERYSYDQLISSLSYT